MILIIYALGWLYGVAFGILISMLIDVLGSDKE